MEKELKGILDVGFKENREAILIGIAGGSGAGKSTLANSLNERLEGRALVIDQDSYYRCKGHLPEDERASVNFDHPDTVDLELLAAHLRLLKKGETIEKPVYDFETHSRIKKTERLEPRPVIIVEGLFLFVLKEMRDIFDLKVYVDADSELRLLRRVQRDVSERGRTIEAVMSQYIDSVKPMHDAFVAQGRKWADCLIKTQGYDVGVAHIIERCVGLLGSSFQSSDQHGVGG